MAKGYRSNVRIEGQETVSDASKRASKSLNRLEKNSESMSRSQRRNIGMLITKWGGYAAAIAAAVLSVKKLINAYAQQEQAERRLATAAGNNPYLDDRSVERIKQFATELQRVSTVGDEVAINMASMLASTGRTEQEIRNIIEASADLSAAMGITMESAVRNLNKTFGGMTGELGEMLPQLKDLTEEQLRSGEAVRLIQKQFDGMAETTAEGTGAFEQFSNTWGDFMEVLGGHITSVLAPLVQELTNVFNALIDINDQIERALGLRMNEGLMSLSDAQKQVLNDLRRELDSLEGEREVIQQRLERQQQMIGTEPPLGISQAAFNERFRTAAAETEAELSAVNAQIRHVKSRIGDMGVWIDEANNTGTAGGGIASQLLDIQKTLKANVAEIESRGILPWVDAEDERQKAIKSALEDMVEVLGTSVGSLEEAVSTWPVIAHWFGELEKEAEEAVRVFREHNLTREGGVPRRGAPSPGSERELARFGTLPSGLGGQGVLGDLVAQIGRTIEDRFAAVDQKGVGKAITGAIGSIGSGLQAITEGFAGAVSSLSKFQAVVNPITTIIQGMLEILEPFLDKVLSPLVGILRILGNVIGVILIPYYEVLARVTEILGRAFVWLHNSIIRPVGNFLLRTFEKVGNFFIDIVRSIIGAINKIPGVNINKPSRIDVSSSLIDRISFSDIMDSGGLGEDTEGTGAGLGSSTTVRRVPDIYITQNFNGNINGPLGIREFGEFTVAAIQAHVGAGGEVTFLEGESA